jgi:hypothetical protein
MSAMLDDGPNKMRVLEEVDEGDKPYWHTKETTVLLIYERDSHAISHTLASTILWYLIDVDHHISWLVMKWKHNILP